jgi:CDGSH-type Zn-finger protein
VPTKKNGRRTRRSPSKRASAKRGRIVVSKDGPYLASGSLPLRKAISVVGEDREPEKWRKGRKYRVGASYRLCRCGRSDQKPFCDNAHTRVHFDGTETASPDPFAEQARRLRGRDLELDDAESLCSSARFCLPKGGTWRLTARSNEPAKRKLAIQQAGNCPSGRLVVYDKKTGKPIEPEFVPSISLTEDPQVGVSGPIWVKGGIPIVSASGRVYEVRNRATLCRCGKSRNKPFCDGSHIRARFSDDDKSLRQ